MMLHARSAPRARGRCGVLRLAAALALVACTRESRETREPVKAEAAAPPSARGTLVSIGAIAPGAAFDLVGAPPGAVVVWGRPDERGGGIALRALDAHGAARGSERSLVPREPPFTVSEIVAAAAGDRIGVAWVESSPAAVRTRSLVVPEGDGVPGQPVLLATVTPELGAGRGRVAIAGLDGGRVRVMYAAGAADCADSQHAACVGFAFEEIEGGARGRREPWLSVPQPCPEGAAHLAGLDGRFFYAVCSWRDDAPSTMAYAINVETYYARADEVLRGCAPLGMVVIDAATVLLGADCGVLRRAARLTLDLKPAAEFPLADLTLECRGDRPAIRATGWELPLHEPRSELEAVLPERIAPVGARAVWTGRALLVAQRMSGRLELRRYACRDGALHSETSASAPGAGR